MALLGSAAMVLCFDIEPAAADEHDDWHTREHLPERLAIPGFVRGSRWRSPEGEPRYMVLYEVADLEVLGSAAYLERLNHPTPWTQKMMKSYRGMRRGFCRVVASRGAGLGGSATLVRFTPAPQREAALRAWLEQSVLPGLAAGEGMASAHLLQAAGTPAMTAEQQLRGRDRDFGWALLATGFGQPPTVRGEQLAEHGVAGATQAMTYRLQCLLGCDELATSSALPR